MESDQIKKLVEAQLQANIIKAFEETPDMIEALVRSIIEQEVTDIGHPPGRHDYNKATMPYLTYAASSVVRRVVMEAVRNHVESMREDIHTQVKEALTKQSVADAVVDAIMKASENEYKINVVFESDD